MAAPAISKIANEDDDEILGDALFSIVFIAQASQRLDHSQFDRFLLALSIQLAHVYQTLERADHDVLEEKSGIET